MKRPTILWKVVSAIALVAVSVAAGYGAEPMTPVGSRPLAAARLASRGNADPNQPLAMRVHFALRNTTELATLLREQQDPASPNYRKWLKTGEFDQRFGPRPSDVKAVVDWLTGEGFKVESSSNGSIDFTGNVNQAQQSFAVRIAGDGAGGYANVDDPMMPARFAGVVSTITGMDNLTRIKPAGLHRRMPRPDEENPQLLALNDSALSASNPSSPAGLATSPQFTIQNITAFGPQDMRTFYDEKVGAGSDGSGTCIALVGVSQIGAGAVSSFDSRFHLPAAKLTTVIAGGNPGATHDGGEIEAELDVEWAHAMAPGASERLYLASQVNNDPLASDIAAAVNDNKCGIISISFSYCAASSIEFTGVLDPLFQKAAAQGQSVFVSSGDEGAADLDAECDASGARGVNEMSADPFVTSVGGTQVQPNYDSKGNDVGYVEEQVWNSDGATGGGVSEVFGKPSYQTDVPGIPNDANRDVPDIALIASPDLPGVFLGDAAIAKPAAIVCCIGGTSLSAPMMAGLVAVIDQQISERIGPLNPILYSLGANQYGPAHADRGFQDIVSGNNGYNGVSGFNAGTGYDQATGLGSIDFAVFAEAVKGNLPAVTTTMVAAPTQVNFGNVDATGIGKPHKVTFTNKGVEIAELGAINVPADFTVVAGSDHCSNATVVPKKSCSVTLKFSPSVVGPSSESLSIPYNGSVSPVTVAVSGVATQVSVGKPASVTFAPVAAGSSSPKAKPVTITNLSATATIQIGAAGLSGPFSIAGDGCAGATLGPKKHCIVSMAFAPPADTASKTSINGSISYGFSYGSNSGTASIPLTGTVK
ncbi:MAG TPA: protease pro-enzyme activation domain-containing protein [Candidatus Binataceae bacterium]|nr:protease pro-enzyme activation domain-containing protein [Candidatus Binataceae bacterium]